MDYALARLQARFGELPDELLWQKVEGLAEPVEVLAISRSCGLSRWVAGIGPDADKHKIEIALRARWRECIAEIASWMPSDWKPALLWARELTDLPARLHLARSGDPLHWMLDDPVLQVYARANAKTRETRMLDGGPAFTRPELEGLDRVVLQATSGTSSMGQAWLDEWRRRWPRWRDTESLENLVRLVDSAMKQPVAISRPELLRQLRSLFRRSVLQPVVAFIYIALAALALQRLRAALLTHDLAQEGVVPA